MARKAFGHVSRYDGMLNCFVRVTTEEGIMGLFKGTAASVVKVNKFSCCQNCFYQYFVLTASEVILYVRSDCMLSRNHF